MSSDGLKKARSIIKTQKVVPTPPLKACLGRRNGLFPRAMVRLYRPTARCRRAMGVSAKLRAQAFGPSLSSTGCRLGPGLEALAREIDATWNPIYTSVLVMYQKLKDFGFVYEDGEISIREAR